MKVSIGDKLKHEETKVIGCVVEVFSDYLVEIEFIDGSRSIIFLPDTKTGKWFKVPDKVN